MLLINDKNFRECPGVYIIKNIITGKEYIGESLNIKRRFGVHARLKSGQRIHKSILKHGIENFQVYCEYFPDLKKVELLQIEEQMIKDYNTLIPNGYNISTGKWYKVCDQFLKRKKSKNHGRNISKAKKGIPLSNEHKLALSKAHTGKKL